MQTLVSVKILKFHLDLVCSLLEVWDKDGSSERGSALYSLLAGRLDDPLQCPLLDPKGHFYWGMFLSTGLQALRTSIFSRSSPSTWELKGKHRLLDLRLSSSPSPGFLGQSFGQEVKCHKGKMLLSFCTKVLTLCSNIISKLGQG